MIAKTLPALVEAAFAKRIEDRDTLDFFRPGIMSRNPFKLSEGVWGCATGSYYGNVVAHSKDNYAEWHWAVVGESYVIFSWEMEKGFTLTPPKNQAGIHERKLLVGSRIFFRCYSAYQYAGVVIKTGTIGGNPSADGWAMLDNKDTYMQAELRSGRIKIGGRQ